MAAPFWQEQLNGNSLEWLLEPDPDNPGPRYFALIDLVGLPPEHPDVIQARQAVQHSGPVPRILAAQDPGGFWVNPGPGYGPKYTGTVWQVIFLAQLGADGSNPQVKRGCDYVLDHTLSPYGGISMDATNAGMIHCLQGNLIAALIDLGWLGDPRFEKALDWMARSITGLGIAISSEKDAPVRYYRSGNSGPNFLCSANNHLPCAWGAVKAASGLSKIPEERREPKIHMAIETAKNFLLSSNPAEANYPSPYTGKPNRSWFQFGYPIGYVTDVLQNLEVLSALGCADEPGVLTGMEYILNKQDRNGRWKMEYTYNGKTWAEIENKGDPSKWVTLRALRVIRQIRTSILHNE